jgi:ABC-type glutathione transport system ATPase component
MSLKIHGLEIQKTDGTPLLGPLWLDLPPGGRVGLAGPSGCGKSLLVRALFGVLPEGLQRAAGTMRAWGAPLGLPSSERDEIRGLKLGWVPQDPLQALNPYLKVKDHLSLLPVAHLGEAPDAALRRLAPWMERLRLPAGSVFLRKRPHELSGGQRQRLCLAMALATEPEWLILDEPTTALDPLVQADFLDLMLELQRQRAFGWLWISHDLGVLAATCTELRVMDHGRIVESGPLAQVLAEPRHPCTARLLAASRRGPLEDSRPA